MPWGFTSESSYGSSISSVTDTCWVTVLIIVFVLIFILVINDLTMNKKKKYKILKKNVKFYDEEQEQENTFMKKSVCS